MSSTTATTSLVISFGGTLCSMLRGTVKPDQLQGALFYLNCREYFYDQACALHEMAGNGLVAEEDKIQVYQTFRAAVRSAEAAGRVAWRENGVNNGWELLNRLLAANDLPTIEPLDEDVPKMGRYNYPMVEKAVAQQRLPYTVIWNQW